MNLRILIKQDIKKKLSEIFRDYPVITGLIKNKQKKTLSPLNNINTIITKFQRYLARESHFSIQTMRVYRIYSIKLSGSSRYI